MDNLRQLRVGIATSQEHLMLMMRSLYSHEIMLHVRPHSCWAASVPVKMSRGA